VLAFSILGIALHPFIVGVVLKQIFGIDLKLLPAGGYCPLHHVPPPTPQEIEEIKRGFIVPSPCRHSAWPWLWLQHMILPWVTFALFFLPFYVRIIRARLIETLGEPYVLTARAKGASELRVLMRHVFRATMATTLAMLAIDLGTAITAAIYVESVYGLPGLSRDALQALGASTTEQGYDLPILVGIVFVIACTVTVLNVVADLLADRLDPRLWLARR
jgi:peptide/nickel transport system permease protein